MSEKQDTYTINDQVYQRIPYGQEKRYDDFALQHKQFDMIPYAEEAQLHPCNHCKVKAGEYHIPGCDVEECPKCENQSISCSCTSWNTFQWNDFEEIREYLSTYEDHGYNYAYIYGCRTNPDKTDKAEWSLQQKIAIDDDDDDNEDYILPSLCSGYQWLIVSSEPKENM